MLHIFGTSGGHRARPPWHAQHPWSSSVSPHCVPSKHVNTFATSLVPYSHGHVPSGNPGDGGTGDGGAAGKSVQQPTHSFVQLKLPKTIAASKQDKVWNAVQGTPAQVCAGSHERATGTRAKSSSSASGVDAPASGVNAAPAIICSRALRGAARARGREFNYANIPRYCSVRLELCGSYTRGHKHMKQAREHPNGCVCGDSSEHTCMRKKFFSPQTCLAIWALQRGVFFAQKLWVALSLLNTHESRQSPGSAPAPCGRRAPRCPARLPRVVVVDVSQLLACVAPPPLPHLLRYSC